VNDTHGCHRVTLRGFASAGRENVLFAMVTAHIYHRTYYHASATGHACMILPLGRSHVAEATVLCLSNFHRLERLVIDDEMRLANDYDAHLGLQEHKCLNQWRVVESGRDRGLGLEEEEIVEEIVVVGRIRPYPSIRRWTLDT
jgi:hypothetical protein